MRLYNTCSALHRRRSFVNFVYTVQKLSWIFGIRHTTLTNLEVLCSCTRSTSENEWDGSVFSFRKQTHILPLQLELMFFFCSTDIFFQLFDDNKMKWHTWDNVEHESKRLLSYWLFYFRNSIRCWKAWWSTHWHQSCWRKLNYFSHLVRLCIYDFKVLLQ